MTESYISTGTGGTSFVGPDAVNLVRAVYLAGSLRLYAKAGIIPTRGVTITKMLAMATGYTGKKYKRGEAERAAADIDEWKLAMKATLPVEAR